MSYLCASPARGRRRLKTARQVQGNEAFLCLEWQRNAVGSEIQRPVGLWIERYKGDLVRAVRDSAYMERVVVYPPRTRENTLDAIICTKTHTKETEKTQLIWPGQSRKWHPIYGWSDQYMCFGVVIMVQIRH